MSRISAKQDCSNTSCQKKGFIKCTRCREATPTTLYCSRKCQKENWQYHKAYCGKQAYTFELTLVGSSAPVIKRTLEVPSWFTFRHLHYTIQYAMSWNCTHLHEFTFSKTRLTIDPKSPYEQDEFSCFGMPSSPREREESLLLRDVFDPSGRLYQVVAPRGRVQPLLYLYDFGDNWQHELVFKGKKPARADRPFFRSIQGRAPIEDCGGIDGWNSIKAAFRTPIASRTSEQWNLLQWGHEATAISSDSQFDPLSEPSVTLMNFGSRWEVHLAKCMEISGDLSISPSSPDSDNFSNQEIREEPIRARNAMGA